MLWSKQKCFIFSVVRLHVVIRLILFNRENDYLFKQVYAFSVEANSLARGFPKNIRDVFPPVESGDHPDGNIDAAYFSYSHNAIFLFKGTHFWRVVGSRNRWRRPFLPRNGLLPHKEVDQQWFDICDVHPTALKLTRWGCWDRCNRSYTHLQM